MTTETLVKHKEILKKRRPKFVRRASKNIKRVSSSWRKPRGFHSKMRKYKKGKPRMAAVGFKGPRALQDVLSSGLREKVVSNLAELKAIDTKTEIAILSSKVGKRKTLRAAKLNLIQIARGCGSWECTCGDPHSIPFKIKGRCGSVRIELLPAPKGTGLVVENDIKKILRLAGIKDVWSKTYGQTGSRANLVEACIRALKESTAMRVKKDLAVPSKG